MRRYSRAPFSPFSNITSCFSPVLLSLLIYDNSIIIAYSFQIKHCQKRSMKVLTLIFPLSGKAHTMNTMVGKTQPTTYFSRQLAGSYELFNQLLSTKPV